jgi:hypothetical protein
MKRKRRKLRPAIRTRDSPSPGVRDFAGDLVQCAIAGRIFAAKDLFFFARASLFLRNRGDPRCSLEAKLLAILTFTKYSLRVGDISRQNAANERPLGVRE